ncbi:MAG: AMP-binding protein [Sphingopyxis sp.]|nr:AMP-binding protein [Sphingopyxis sp.]
MGNPSRWVLPAVLEEQAENHGERQLVSMMGGDGLSYAAMRDDAAQVAGMLADRGIRPGDHVALMLPNGLDFLRAWFGVTRLGAVAVLLNTELTGAFLAHPIRDSAPAALIIDPVFCPRFDEIRGTLPDIAHILVTDPGLPEGFDTWRQARAFEGPMPAASDIACIMYTSGTTGAPKGVLMPHAHCFLFGYGTVENLGVTADDHYYICLPLSHANGLLMQLGAVLIAGIGASIRDRFSASAWIDDIRDSGATLTNALGAISAFVVTQPATDGDRDHRLRAILAAPNHPDHERIWRARYGVADVIGGYGMTEVNIPLYGARGDARPGACGKPYAHFFEVAIRDPDTGQTMRVDEAGEICVRPKAPNGFMAGYHGLPEKTVEAWRDLWFHTGDAGRMDADGYVYFIDRIKDCIRRRGENISATDIEMSFSDLPGVAEIAAYPVPSDIPGGEDEIMLAIVRRPGVELTPLAIIDHARSRIPRYAQPRYVDFVASLPKTGTEKVRKTDLRKTGVTFATIDLSALSVAV